MANAVLSIADGFAVRPGAPSPYAGKVFTLLRESLESILQKAGVRPPPGTSVVRAWLNACTTGQPVCQQGVAAVDSHAVAATNFGAGRQTQFPAVPPGTYYLFGATRHNNQPFLWNLRVELKPGANVVTLDQRNSSPVD